MSQQNKRYRGKNFSDAEESLLIDLAYPKRGVIENKKSDAKTWREKDECWEKLAIEFASQSGIVRTARALKDKYDNLKRRYKAAAAAETQKTWHISRDPLRENCSSYIQEKLALILNKSATGLKKTIDSDSKVSSNNDSATASQNDEETSVSSNICATHLEDDTNPLQFWKEINEDAESTISGKKNFTPKYSPAFEEEKIRLIKLQQNFFRDENIRAAEKHKEDIKILRLKSQLLELEVAEKKKRLLME